MHFPGEARLFQALAIGGRRSHNCSIEFGTDGEDLNASQKAREGLSVDKEDAKQTIFLMNAKGISQKCERY